MRSYKLESFTRGWFVGDFDPSLIKTQEFEAAVQYYEAGAEEEEHLHKIATEITVIVSGRVQISGVEYVAGDVVVIAPGELSRFVALENSITTVIKYPGAKNDKYLRSSL